MTTKGTEPASGKPYDARMSSVHKDKDTRVFTMSMKTNQTGGEFIKIMEITYIRQPNKASDSSRQSGRLATVDRPLAMSQLVTAAPIRRMVSERCLPAGPSKWKASHSRARVFSSAISLIGGWAPTVAWPHRLQSSRNRFRAQLVVP